MAKSKDDVSEALCAEVTALVDKATLDAGLGQADAAQVYRELAAECRDRAACLDEEAEAEA